MEIQLAIAAPPNIRLLLVDDEPSVLKALNRLFYDLNVDIRTADSGQQALELLNQEGADIIISDMRMPGMDGAELFTEVASLLPESERILLTGYSDLESTIDAINKGKVNFYVEKPWDNERLRKIVCKAIDIIQSKHRMLQLERQVHEQNEQLQAWNNRLESLVDERTKELERSNGQLQQSLQKVRSSYQNTVELFSGLIEQRMGEQQINRRTIAWILDAMGKTLGLEDKPRKSLVYAGILRNVGKLSFDDVLLNTPYLELSALQQRKFQQHIDIAVNLMSSIPPLAKASEMIAQRHEYEDGSGYPHGKSAFEISDYGAALAVVGDYFQYCQGSVDGRCYTPEEALALIVSQTKVKYRATVVEAFKQHWQDLCGRFHLGEEKLATAQLRPGMVLSRNFYSSDCKLLVAEGVALDDGVINQLKKLQDEYQEQWHVYIQD